jgi:replicative DNA helicase
MASESAHASEQAILGAALIDATRLSSVPAPSEFFTAAHQRIAEAISDCAENGDPIDVITVAERLERGDALNAVGGLAYLVSLRDNAVPANIAAHARMVREAATVRELRAAAADVDEIAHSALPVAAKVDQAQQRVMRVRADAAVDVPLLSVRIEAAKVVAAARATGAVQGLPTNFRGLDALLHGLKSGELIIVAGRPSMGKSAFVGQFTEVCCRQGVPVMFFSLEMSAQQVLDRMVASEANVPLQDVLHARTPHIGPALDRIGRWPMVLDDQGALNVLQIAQRARQAKLRHGIRAVVIDYLQLMPGPGGKRDTNRNAEIEATTRGLKALAKELQVPVIVLSQLNRGLETRPNHRPMLADLRDSGSIEQDADVVIAIHREEVYRSHNPGEWAGLAEAIVLKNRQGATGTARLRWEGARVRFSEFSGEWPTEGTTVRPIRRAFEG